MPRAPRRGLFWRVYPTLLASLLLVAVLGAGIWHLFGVAPLGPVYHAPGRPPRGIALHSLGLLLVAAAVVGVAAYPVMGRLTRRLEALRLSVEAWGGDDPGRRAAVDGNDEIAAVAVSFNGAADRAQALLDAHKALLAHASHDLRAPLTRLALAVELLAADIDPDRADTVRREIAELDGLVGEILLASRLDHGVDLDEVERVDLLALAAEEAARASVTLRAVPAASVTFERQGSPRLLRRMIRNLIDNALDHGAAPIEVSLGRGEASITIAVHDHGPGVPAALRRRVFEPFFRPEGWTESSGGWGLGLSLVRQIAERHGGRADCVSGDDGLTRFIVELPAPKAAAVPPRESPPAA